MMMAVHKSFGRVPPEVINTALLAPVGESLKLIRKHEPYFAFTHQEFSDLIESKQSEIEDIKSEWDELKDDIDDLEDALTYCSSGRAHRALTEELRDVRWEMKDGKSRVETLSKEIKALQEMRRK